MQEKETIDSGEGKVIDMAKAFEDTKPKEEKEPTQEEINQSNAIETTRAIVALMSGASIRVKIKKPCRKEDWSGIGFLIGVVANFHTHRVKVVVAYSVGIEKKFGKEKKFVPYTDTMFIDNIIPLEIIENKNEIDNEPSEKES